MKTIGNIFWFLFTGLASGLMWGILGLFWCITIVGIPFGKQCFKFARLAFFPFGTDVKSNFGSHPIANVIWFIFGGVFLSIAYLFLGIVWCITIIGIPFGKQCFKFSKLALAPFGASIS